MKQLNYSLICEDIAHVAFIEALLPFLLEQDDVIFFNQKFFKDFKARNSKDVINRYSNASIVAFRDYNLDLLLIGIDYDDRNRNYFEKEIKYLYSKIVDKIRYKSVIFFPVQAIEHWLLIIQFKIQNPISTKNIAGKIEGLPRKKAKIDLFGSVYLSKKDQKQKISEIVNQIDIDWLISRSESFRKFNYDLNNFFTQINKQ